MIGGRREADPTQGIWEASAAPDPTSRMGERRRRTGWRIICAGFDDDPERIVMHMLQMPAELRCEGIAV